jgi:serine/threonine-protein kinase
MVENSFKNNPGENGIEWAEMLDKLFGSNIPETAKWTRKEAIIGVLNTIGLTRHKNHGFFPSGGGLDLLGANFASDNNSIELNFGRIYICEPSSLQFESFDADKDWFYFRLETNVLKPKLEKHSHRECFEDLIELRTGEFVELEKQNDDDIFRNFYRDVTIILSGSIVIFSKSSVYNAVSSTYDGRHSKMSAETFRKYISEIINKRKEIS